MTLMNDIEEKITFELPNEYEHRVILGTFIQKKRKKQSFLDMNRIRAAIEANVQNGKKGFKEIYGEVDLASFFTSSRIQEGVHFPCLFFGEWNYDAWIYTNEDGVSRYYTQSPGRNRKVRLDLVDLLGYELNTKSKARTMESLKRLYPFAETVDSEAEAQRLERNLADFTAYQATHRNMLGDEFLPVYEHFIAYATKRIYDGHTFLNGKSLFFLSVNTMADELYYQNGVDAKHTTVANQMNWLVTLGFVRKVKESEMPAALQQRRIVESFVETTGKNGKQTYEKNQVTFYVISTVKEVLYQAEKRYRKLARKGVKYHQLTQAKLEKVLGETIAKDVYPNKTKVKRAVLSKEKKAFVKAFYCTLRTKGFVLKSDLTGICPKATTDKLWTQLVRETRGVARKMSQLLKDALRILGEGAVFMTNHFLYPFIPLEEEEDNEKLEEAYVEPFINLFDEWLAVRMCRTE